MPVVPLFATTKPANTTLFIQSLGFSLLCLPGGYNGSGTWTSSTSAGSSGSNTFVDSGAAPPGLTSNYATFNGTTQKMTSTYNMSTFVDQGGTTLITIARFAAAGPVTSSLTVSGYMSTSGSPSRWGLSHQKPSGTDGVNMHCMNLTSSVTAGTLQAVSLNTWYMHIGRWDNSALKVKNRLNTTNAADTSVSGVSSNVTGANNLILGASADGTNFHQMDLRMVAIAPSIISDANLTTIYNEAVSQGWLT